MLCSLKSTVNSPKSVVHISKLLDYYRQYHNVDASKHKKARKEFNSRITKEFMKVLDRKHDYFCGVRLRET